jgi:hypothetical protein
MPGDLVTVKTYDDEYEGTMMSIDDEFVVIMQDDRFEAFIPRHDVKKIDRLVPESKRPKSPADLV